MSLVGTVVSQKAYVTPKAAVYAAVQVHLPEFQGNLEIGMSVYGGVCG